MSFLSEGFMRLILRAAIETIFPPRESEVVVRQATRDAIARLVMPQIVSLAVNKEEIEPLSVTALLPYRTELIQSLVLEAKFEKNRRAQALLGSVVTDYIKVWSKTRTFEGQPPPNMILVPLPLGEKRRKERGYNQVEEVSLFAMQTLHADDDVFTIRLATDLLMRVRETAPQMTLGKAARLLNMREAFGLAHPTSPLDPSLTYILLDDVVTTGASLAAAHDTLIKAGAKQILVLALAH